MISESKTTSQKAVRIVTASLVISAIIVVAGVLLDRTLPDPKLALNTDTHKNKDSLLAIQKHIDDSIILRKQVFEQIQKEDEKKRKEEEAENEELRKEIREKIIEDNLKRIRQAAKDSLLKAEQIKAIEERRIKEEKRKEEQRLKEIQDEFERIADSIERTSKSAPIPPADPDIVIPNSPPKKEQGISLKDFDFSRRGKVSLDMSKSPPSNGIAVREEANNETTIISTLNGKDKLPFNARSRKRYSIGGKEGYWYLVSVGDKSGYVFGYYLKEK